jgi:hypothetical protein
MNKGDWVYAVGYEPHAALGIIQDIDHINDVALVEWQTDFLSDWISFDELDYWENRVEV